jgi:hypothetical protein
MNCSPAPNQLGVRGDGVRARLDIADALDLVAAGAREPCGIVAFALSMAGVADADLDSIRDRSLRQLYRDGELPIPVTLGALIVLDAAQRSQGRGRAADKVLDDAAAAASRFLDLAPVLPGLLH